jgi:hypothetical protein
VVLERAFKRIAVGTGGTYHAARDVERLAEQLDVSVDTINAGVMCLRQRGLVR